MDSLNFQFPIKPVAGGESLVLAKAESFAILALSVILLLPYIFQKGFGNASAVLLDNQIQINNKYLHLTEATKIES
ncbi:MAG: hypothetical protein EBZ47_05740 [Chlamydiae bacterium]|nr:hypothetical protein [Chlamydiota bacterium]